MTKHLLGRRAALITGGALLAAPRLARAAWPERPVRIIVAFPPGSSTDGLVRTVAAGVAPATRLGEDKPELVEIVRLEIGGLQFGIEPLPCPGEQAIAIEGP